MGNSTSSGRGHHEETVDFGYLIPQGVYTGPRDWNQAIVAQLIGERKLAPFYRPLEDYDDSWDDEQILAARKELLDLEGGAPSGDGTSVRAESVSSNGSKVHHKRASNAKEPARHPEAGIYRGAVECPICFLYYPANINHSRCCDQAICTECFVQIKRSEPTATHLVSEPAACPYCVQENFGIVYTPPSWRAGLGSEGAPPPTWLDPSRTNSQQAPEALAVNAQAKRRRKSFGADSPDVVTIDMIRPDWEAKLAAVRAAVARRANRRIIMRQVGDRLIPVGVTSGRVHALPTEEGQTEGDPTGERGSRRSRRRVQNQDINQYLGSMGLGGQDLEELMIMEAMRLSLIEHEEQQKRERDEAAKKAKEGGAGIAQESEGTSSSPSAPVPTIVTPDAADTPSDGDRDAASFAIQSDAPSVSEESSITVPGDALDASPPAAESSALSLAPGSSEAVSSPTLDAHSFEAQVGESSALAAAIHSASSLASAIGSPNPEGSADGDVHSRRVSRPQTPAMTPDDSPSGNVETEGEPTAGAKRIPLAHTYSIASSVGASADSSVYDILSSSPGSTVSQKPLLEHVDSVSSPVAIEAEQTSE